MPSDSGASQFLLIELGQELYALDGAAVREVLPTAPATRLPAAPPFVRGLVNVRGRLLTVIDLAHRITGMPARNPDGSTIVVQFGEQLLGLSVDDVRHVQGLMLDSAGALHGHTASQGLIRGVGRLEDEVVLVIDVEELIRQTLA